MKFKYMWREGIHKILLKGFSLIRPFDLEVMNKPVVEGPVIYAAVHTNSYDVPVVMSAIENHSYLFASDEVKGKISGLGFELNGVVYVHREDKESRKQGIEQLARVIKDGKSVVMFPEGTWNTTPSSPILNLPWGIIDLAQDTNSPIVPIVTEYYKDKCIVRFGEILHFSKLNENVTKEEQKIYKKQCIDKLEESLATMKWELWEQYGGIYDRNDGNLNEKTLTKYKKDYPVIDYEYEKQFHFNKVKYLEDICPINVVEVNKRRK